MDKNSPLFVGASKHSNNTGEITAIINGLIYLYQNYLGARECEKKNLPVTKIEIIFDSEIAAKSILGLYKGKQNSNLISKGTQILYHVVQRFGPNNIKFLHIKAHSCPTGWNTSADKFAKIGAQGISSHFPILRLHPDLLSDKLVSIVRLHKLLNPIISVADNNNAGKLTDNLIEDIRLSKVTEEAYDNNNRNSTSFKYQNRNLVSVHSQEMLMIDCDWTEIGGMLTAFQRSMKYIPGNLVKLVRKVFIKVMGDFKNNPTDLLLWKKFVILPSILFTDNGSERRTGIKKAALQILQNDWSFKIKDIRPRINHSQSFNLESIKSRVTRLMTVGEISRACNQLTSLKRSIEKDRTTFEELKTLFPSRQPENEFSVDLDLNYSNPDLDSFQPINPEFLATRIKSKGKLIAPGCSNLRYEHISQLIGDFKDSDEIAYTTLLAWFIDSVFHASCPKEISILLSDSEVFPIPKNAVSGCRPIMIGDVYRKLAASAGVECFSEVNYSILGDIQQGVQRKFGTEIVYHSMRLAGELTPHFDRIFADFRNAFNEMIRNMGLEQTKLHFPLLYPHLMSMYGNKTKSWFFGLEEGIQSISNEEGIQQGDLLGCIQYALGAHPFFKEINKIAEDETFCSRLLTSKGFCRAYLDDLSTAGSHESSLKIITYILSEGPKFGFHLHLGKTIVLLGSCSSYEEALHYRQNYVMLGLKIENIHIHPNNSRDQLEKDTLGKSYGVKCLGSPLGHDLYIKHWLSLKLEELREFSLKLAQLDTNSQVLLLLFRYCFVTKINFLQRTIEPSLLKDFISSFEQIKIQFLSTSILQIDQSELSESAILQSKLHIKDGGLGLFNSSDITDAAYSASFICCLEEVSKLFPQVTSNLNDYEKSNDVSFVKNHSSLLAFILAVKRLQVKDCELKLSELLKRTDNLNNLQKELSKARQHSRVEELLAFMENDKRSLARFKSCIGFKNEASQWLEAIPKFQALTISHEKFKIALNLRLGLKQPIIPPGLKCSCKKIVDQFGHHFSTLCGKWGFRHRTHNAVTHTVDIFVKRVGFTTIREDNKIFEGFSYHSRPDLTVLNPPLYKKGKVVIDSVVTNPTNGSTNLTKEEALTTGRAGKVAEKGKFSKYTKHHCIPSNELDLLPLAFESFGTINESGLLFLEALAKRGETTLGIKYKVLLNYWLKRISVCLQDAIAESILKRSYKYHSNDIESYDHSVSKKCIMESSIVRCSTLCISA